MFSLELRSFLGALPVVINLRQKVATLAWGEIYTFWAHARRMRFGIARHASAWRVDSGIPIGKLLHFIGWLVANQDQQMSVYNFPSSIFGPELFAKLIC